MLWVERGTLYAEHVWQESANERRGGAERTSYREYTQRENTQKTKRNRTEKAEWDDSTLARRREKQNRSHFSPFNKQARPPRLFLVLQLVPSLYCVRRKHKEMKTYCCDRVTESLDMQYTEHSYTRTPT